MKIYSVAVDELPTSCTDCRLTKWSTDGKRTYCFCVMRGEMINLIKYRNSRPLNCPLELKKEIDKLETDLAVAMDAINGTDDHSGRLIEICDSDDHKRRYYENKISSRR